MKDQLKLKISNVKATLRQLAKSYPPLVRLGTVYAKISSMKTTRLSSILLASVTLTNISPLVLDLKRSYISDNNAVIEFQPPTLKFVVEVKNPSQTQILQIDQIKVIINYKSNNKSFKHKFNIEDRNLLKINSEKTTVGQFQTSTSGLLTLEPMSSLRLGGVDGWVVLDNIIPKQNLDYGEYMDVTYEESELIFLGRYKDGKKHLEKIKFYPTRR